MNKFIAAAAAASIVSFAGVAQGAVIHALPGGIAAPIDSVPFQWTTGPKTTVGGAITWSSEGQGLFGYGGDSWAFSHNGEWVYPTFAAIDGSQNAMTFTFATPVAAFLADMNWAPDERFPVTLEAYNSTGILLESLELSNGWTNSTSPGYLGFGRAEAEIASFKVRNGYAGVRDIMYSFTSPLSSSVPEPATWAMMIIGFGASGSMLRRSRLQPQRHIEA